MANVTRKKSAQGLDTRLIELDAGESATITFAPDKPGGVGGKVMWVDGGVTWAIKPKTEGDSINVSVEYSLYDSGDEDWTPHEDSPFTAVHQDGEFARISRIKLTNDAGSNTVYIPISSNGNFTVETA